MAAHVFVHPGDAGSRLHEVQGEERKQLMSEKVEQLVEAGASVAWVNENVGGHSIVLRDPEGNEFCVA